MPALLCWFGGYVSRGQKITTMMFSEWSLSKGRVSKVGAKSQSSTEVCGLDDFGRPILNVEMNAKQAWPMSMVYPDYGFLECSKGRYARLISRRIVIDHFLR